MTAPPAPRQRAAERGFTLIEILIVMVILMILVIGAWVIMQSARIASRNDAMKTAAATMDTAFGTFNRMYPALPNPTSGAVSDPLMALPASMTSNPPGSAPGSLRDETNESILQAWPSNPYRSGGVLVTRHASPAPCAATTGTPGEIRVCRMGGAAGAQTYTISAYGRNRDGVGFRLYTASHGHRGG